MKLYLENGGLRIGNSIYNHVYYSIIPGQNTIDIHNGDTGEEIISGKTFDYFQNYNGDTYNSLNEISFVLDALMFTKSEELLVNDIDWENSDFTGWTGNPQDLFGNISGNGIYNDSSDSIKSFTLALKRTSQITIFGIGTNTGSFKNVKANLIGSGGFERGALDASDDPRDKTSLVYDKEQLVFNKMLVEFHTTDKIDITNIFLKNKPTSRLVDFVHKWGVNPEVDAAQIEDIWDIGGIYTYTTTPQPYFISSSSANDVQEIAIELILYDNGYLRRYPTVVQLQGQTKVQIPTLNNLPCAACNSAYNEDGSSSSAAIPLEGQVYIYEDTPILLGVPIDLSKVRSSIRIGVGQTQQAVYTVPHYLEDGRQVLWAEVFKWRCALAKKQDSAAVASFIVSEPFKVSRTRDADAVTQSVPAVGVFGENTPLVVPPGSDMSVRVSEVTANDSAFGAKILIKLVMF